MSGPLEYTSPELIPGIVADLRDTFDSGVTRPIAFRKEQLRRFYDLMTDNEDKLVDALYKDLRKPKLEAVGGDLLPVKEEIVYMIENIDKLSKHVPIKPRYLMHASSKNVIRKEPLGVVLIIGAWNYPVNLALTPVIGALAAGNTVPSEVSAHTAALLTELLPRYVDSRAIRIVNGGVEETTALLKERFDHILYTGNGMVGKIIMKAAAEHLTPVTLELGGKSPVIVTPDSDIQLTANRLAWGKFYNCGQTCLAPDYVLMPHNMVEPFTSAFRDSLSRFHGLVPQSSKSYSRIVSPRHFDRVTEYIKSTSGKVVIGGETDKDDLYIAPTVIVNPGLEDKIMQDEIFGPVLPIVGVNDVDEAIKYVNSRDNPLALYIFGKDKKTIQKVLDHTRSGGVVVNDSMIHFLETNLPFGGVGPSGMGAYHGAKSFDTFTHNRSTMIRAQAMESLEGAVKYPPYTDRKIKVFTTLAGSYPWFKKQAELRLAKLGVGAIILLLGYYFKKRRDSRL